jgi:hypothetical protein
MDRKAKRERQRVALCQAQARHKERWAEFWRTRYERLASETVRGRMILAMLPVEWYARSDLVVLIGGRRDHRVAVTRRLLAFGLVEREPNPEYGATERSAEPQWLYQLTPLGEAWREELKEEQASFGRAHEQPDNP